MRVTFLGATEEVTGSRYLVESGSLKILVDCGLFQGDKKMHDRNWAPFPLDPKTINAIILTHAHIDHSGYLPVVVKNGFKGPIYCTKATYELCALLLTDSAMLQEEQAKKAAQYSTQPRPLLYTQADVQQALSLFKTVDFDQKVTLGNNITFHLTFSGHILGAGFIILSDGKRTITFTGDLGRSNQLILKNPHQIEQTDFLVLDSTYGDRLHDKSDEVAKLAQLINATVARKGIIIIPIFAVERTQTILYILHMLKQKKIIPDIPIFLDSPLAIKVTNLYCDFVDQTKLPASCRTFFQDAQQIGTPEQSKKLNSLKDPAIIIAGSGMSDGGRILDHLIHFIGDAKNTVIFVGYQAVGTHGRALVDGDKTIQIAGKYYSVQAQIEKMSAFSAHADYQEILQWLSHFKKSPRKVFLTHGEVSSLQSLKEKIEAQFHWSVTIPTFLESFNLDLL